VSRKGVGCPFFRGLPANTVRRLALELVGLESPPRVSFWTLQLLVFFLPLGNIVKTCSRFFFLSSGRAFFFVRFQKKLFAVFAHSFLTSVVSNELWWEDHMLLSAPPLFLRFAAFFVFFTTLVSLGVGRMGSSGARLLLFCFAFFEPGGSRSIWSFWFYGLPFPPLPAFLSPARISSLFFFDTAFCRLFFLCFRRLQVLRVRSTFLPDWAFLSLPQTGTAPAFPLDSFSFRALGAQCLSCW